MELKNYLAKLYEIEEQIEAYYINMAELESLDSLDTLEYNNNLIVLKNLIEKEKEILIILNNNFPINIIQKEINKTKQASNPLPISLGHLTQSYHFRLLNILDDINEDDLILYASILKNDINKILLAFLNNLIGNPAYKNIAEDLIFFKYNLIYMDYYLEDKFLKQIPSSEISLEINNYRTEYLPSYKYVDKTILVLESYNYINYLQAIPNDIDITPNKETMIIISIIELLARFILCNQETLDLIYPDFKALHESELTNEFIITSINDIENILKDLKEHIGWTR